MRHCTLPRIHLGQVWTLHIHPTDSRTMPCSHCQDRNLMFRQRHRRGRVNASNQRNCCICLDTPQLALLNQTGEHTLGSSGDKTHLDLFRQVHIHTQLDLQRRAWHNLCIFQNRSLVSRNSKKYPIPYADCCTSMPGQMMYQLQTADMNCGSDGPSPAVFFAIPIVLMQWFSLPDRVELLCF